MQTYEKVRECQSLRTAKTNRMTCNTHYKHRETNRSGWAQLVHNGCKYTRPFGPPEFVKAKELLDANGWIPWQEVKSVLCLGGGGGQQGPLFASLGYNVTVVDLSPDQLARDRQVMEEHGFQIELIEGDMLDLSPLHGRDFDLVYQPPSAHFVRDIHQVYGEITKVLRKEGYYFVSHWNLLYQQLSDPPEWDGSGYRIVRPQRSGEAVPLKSWKIEGKEYEIGVVTFMHTLVDIIGGLIAAGFLIQQFDESFRGNTFVTSGSVEHLAAFFPLVFNIFCSKSS